MLLLFIGGILLAWHSEAAGNPIHQQLGVAAADGNMEGKEVRFGIFNSALFATITTDASCGAVNSMHDSFTALGGFVPLFNIQLGEIIFGGVGAGLYGMLVFVVLAVFIAGLMVGRTPEYLGKKIEVLRREDGDAFAAHSFDFDSGFRRVGSGEQMGPGRFEQQRPARAQRNSLRLQLRHGQQRQRVRWSDREHAVVQHHAWHRDVVRPFHHDRADSRARRFVRAEESHAAERGHISRLTAAHS